MISVKYSFSEAKVLHLLCGLDHLPVLLSSLSYLPHALPALCHQFLIIVSLPFVYKETKQSSLNILLFLLSSSLSFPTSDLHFSAFPFKHIVDPLFPSFSESPS